MASMKYFDFDMSNSTNTVVHFDGEDDDWSKLYQTITHQLVLSWQESLINGIAVRIILCFHVLHIPYLLIFGYVDYLQWIYMFKTFTTV